MACFMACTQLFGSLGAFILGKLITVMEIETQEDKGRLIAAAIAIPCLLSALFFYIAGIFYAREKASTSDPQKYAYRNRHLVSMYASRFF
jgi:surface polysaccharide O-acyltransferase-like enzyme